MEDKDINRQKKVGARTLTSVFGAIVTVSNIASEWILAPLSSTKVNVVKSRELNISRELNMSRELNISREIER